MVDDYVAWLVFAVAAPPLGWTLTLPVAAAVLFVALGIFTVLLMIHLAGRIRLLFPVAVRARTRLLFLT